MQSLLTRRNCDSGSRSLNFKAAVLYCSWFPRCLPRKSNKPNCCMSFHDADEETWAGRTCTHPICRLLSYSVAAASVMKRQLSRQDQQAGDHLLRRLPVLPNRRRCRLWERQAVHRLACYTCFLSFFFTGSYVFSYVFIWFACPFRQNEFDMAANHRLYSLPNIPLEPLKTLVQNLRVSDLWKTYTIVAVKITRTPDA